MSNIKSFSRNPHIPPAMRQVTKQQRSGLKKKATAKKTTTKKNTPVKALVTAHGHPVKETRSNGWRSGSGRPTKLTPAVQKTIVQALEKGLHIEHACGLAGIAKPTYWEWLQRGYREIAVGLHDEPFAVFTNAVLGALSRFALKANEKVRKGRKHVWQAHAWLLERRFPHLYGRWQRMEMTGPEGGPIEFKDRVQLELKNLSVDELLQLKTLLAKAKAGQEIDIIDIEGTAEIVK